jgi:hypothetical protein
MKGRIGMEACVGASQIYPQQADLVGERVEKF